MFLELTTKRWTPPLQDDSSRSALTGISLQCVTQTLVTVGATGAEVIHTGSVPRLWRYHTMAGLKRIGLQNLTTSISSLLGLVACMFAGVDILTGTTGWECVAAVCDLKWLKKKDLSDKLEHFYSVFLTILLFVLPASCCQSRILTGWFFRWAFGGHPDSSCWSFHRVHRCDLYMSLEHSLPGVNARSTVPNGGRAGV